MYSIKKDSQAYKIARLMTGEWVSALRVVYEWHIIDMHARLQDILKADGVLDRREISIDGVSHTEYTIARMPRIEGWDADKRERFNRYELIDRKPAPNAPSWVPPPPLARLAA